MPEAITIVGGGLAGLTLGIALRQRGVPVVVCEAGQYPRHRVCGEFICGRGQETLERLGLTRLLQDAGACWARNAAFFDAIRSLSPRALPYPALCISRFALDHVLAEEFQRLGGELKAGQRWRGGAGEGIVQASGRRMEAVVEGWRWVGLKTHVKNASLAADMELHFVPDGYVGLCRLAEGVVNVCGLFRSRMALPDLSKTWRQWLHGPPGSTLHARLASAEFNEAAFCAVAGVDMRPRHAADLDACCIGDALTMIPPMTGNGMSMAFESAEMAAGPLEEFSRGRLAWDATRQAIASACDARFASRLFWAGWLQRTVFLSGPRSALLSLASRWECVSKSLFLLTR